MLFFDGRIWFLSIGLNKIVAESVYVEGQFINWSLIIICFRNIKAVVLSYLPVCDLISICLGDLAVPENCVVIFKSVRLKRESSYF